MIEEEMDKYWAELWERAHQRHLDKEDLKLFISKYQPTEKLHHFMRELDDLVGDSK